MGITIQGSMTDQDGHKRYALMSLSTHGPFDLAIQVDNGARMELNREQMYELAKVMKFLVKDF